MAETASDRLERTPLYDLHRALGAKLVPFAGYEMPVQYADGIMAEHLQTRSAAGLFDVSHMGQLRLSGPEAVAALETLVPGDIAALKPGRMRYTVLTNEGGGILDDLMVTNAGDHLFVVVNASRKADDLEHLRQRIGDRVTIEPLTDRALVAVQGPGAASALAALAPDVGALRFMAAAAIEVAGIPAFVTRSGYTGEDGFELSLPADAARRLCERLLEQPGVKPVGLGARDSLRLEAGLCLYGHDIDETTTVAEADLGWTVGPRRRAEGGFPGAATILKQLAEGAPRKRVGILPDGRAPARENTEIHVAGRRVGTITSGGFGPTAGRPIAMGYVGSAAASAGTAVELLVRGTPRPARVQPLPFVPHRYHRG